MVPLFDPHPQHVRVRAKVLKAVNAVLDSGQFIMGPNVQKFEQEAAASHGLKHAVAVASGTDALLLALLAAGVGEGDEVITSPVTFMGTLEASQQGGATAVLAV